MAADDLREPGAPLSRGRLLRELIVFQGKLLLDGLRDVLLSPASLLLGLIDLLSAPQERHRFHNLLALGRRSERWIDLFGAAAPEPPADPDDPTGPVSVDDVVNKVEQLIRDQYRSGSMSDNARQALDRGLAGLRRRRARPVAGSAADTDPLDPPNPPDLRDPPA